MSRALVCLAAVAVVASCEPWNGEDLTAIGSAPMYRSLAAGIDRTCGIGADGSAWCWGLGPTGTQSPTDKCPQPPIIGLASLPLDCMKRPALVAGHHHFVSLASSNATLGVDDAGAVWAWGDNIYGILGFGDLQGWSPTPVRVAGTQAWRFSSIAQGRTTACGVTTDGRLVCWGERNLVTAGVSVGVQCPVPGQSPACVVVPTELGAGTTWTSVVVGEEHACARDQTGAVYCWGNGARGQLGISPVGGTCPAVFGTVACKLIPTRVAGTQLFASIAAQQDETCGITTVGQLMCWGKGAINFGTPLNVAGSIGWAAVAVGGIQSAGPSACAVRTDGTLWCFGPGQIGANVLHQVGLAASLTGVTLGDRQACAWSAAGDAWCLGSMDFGQAGDGTAGVNSFRATPLPVVLPYRD